MKILIVDDSQHVIDMLMLLLEDSNSEIISALNPLDAFSILSHHIFDIIITDINMPFMNGIEFCKKIREMNIQTFIIVFSAEVIEIENYQLNVIEIGNAVYIEKKDPNKVLMEISKITLPYTK